jgi:DNA-binding transcriptional regulator YiaG
MAKTPSGKGRDDSSSGLRGRLLGAFGQTRGGGVDTKRAAAALGVQPRTVQRWVDGTHSPSKRSSAALGAVEKAESHRPRWITPNDEGAVSKGLLRTGKTPPVQDVRAQLLASYGRPDGTLDTKRAATGLGVSGTTVRRWFHGESRPKMENQAKLREQVRTASVDTKRGSRLRNMGAKAVFTAVTTVSNDTRTRTIELSGRNRLTGAQMDAILDAYARGGEPAAARALEDAVNEGYASGFSHMSLSNVTGLDLIRD